MKKIEPGRDHITIVRRGTTGPSMKSLTYYQANHEPGWEWEQSEEIQLNLIRPHTSCPASRTRVVVRTVIGPDTAQSLTAYWANQSGCKGSKKRHRWIWKRMTHSLIGQWQDKIKSENGVRRDIAVDMEPLTCCLGMPRVRTVRRPTTKLAWITHSLWSQWDQKVCAKNSEKSHS